ncbi:hypothetical protein P170DRAFT_351315 [Aspergillus steynii IBT 23096]|uniref:Uncharacterized protein n=1 Tax=Aspergillus steynii IBT 23096 TaxID=1392250 RepID=A0A2I2GG40_9EURO|nr:uncharacterized protein P170DRAFT_351315 [Aspergillus steynii IBT 23096]PLB51842.1 hypothetical protein P170DRAFT_351315 [Aspergillus steynii IBT 23096]
MVGKRKRDSSVVSRSTTAEDQETVPTAPIDTHSHDVFRKFFEAQFQPIELPGDQFKRDGKENAEETDEEVSEGSEGGSEWGGLSGEDEGDNKVEVVEHRELSTRKGDELDKKARKAFMTAKPPSLSSKSTTDKRTPNKVEKSEEDKAGDADDLKNDLALQRLLKESHLLESASELAPTGKNRLKALDLRMQTLGAKTSLYKQNMPSSHRKGIKAKAEQREDKRRREAKENGIILEKPAPKKAGAGRRERGVGGPSVGKFAGGTLNLSKRDISAIQGPSRSSSRSSRGRGRGRR